MTAAYILATLVLCSALIFSYFTLKRILTEQSRLSTFGATTSELSTTIRESTLYLSDLKEAKRLPTSESRLQQKIETKIHVTLDNLHVLKNETSSLLAMLASYDYYDDFNNMFNGPPDNIWLKLDQYVSRLSEISTDSNYGAPGRDLLWLPVEATAAKNGALGQSYGAASSKLQKIIAGRSSDLDSTHKKLTVISLLIILLEVSLIFVPLKRRLVNVNKNLLSAHKDLFVQANYDSQTGLSNAAGVVKMLQTEDFKQQYGCLFIVCLDNIDGISRIIGPTALDLFFNDFVRQLESINSDKKFIFRAGDAEFGILLHDDVDLSNSSFVLDIQKLLDQRLQVDNTIVHPATRLGYATGEITNHNFLSKLIDARLSVQHYVRSEKKIPRYEPHMRSSIEDEGILVEKIRLGITNKEFIPFYQLKVDAKTGLACGMEALCRWKLSDGSMRSPFEFIPVAEKSGLITEITWQLLEQISKDYNAWLEKGLQPGRVAFNAAEIFLRETDFPARITEIVRSTNTVECPLDLEITENVALGSDDEVISNAISTARQLGLGIALDDFGTGYASLSSIVGLDVDIIKVDQSFVRVMSESADSKTIVLTIIYMCQQLEKKCVVEGVETKEEWEFCRDQGCDEIQGYFFHKPASFSCVSASLAHEQSSKKTA